jgi:hypothetical protein
VLLSIVGVDVGIGVAVCVRVCFDVDIGVAVCVRVSVDVEVKTTPCLSKQQSKPVSSFTHQVPSAHWSTGDTVRAVLQSG